MKGLFRSGRLYVHVLVLLLSLTGCIGILDGCGNSRTHITDDYYIVRYPEGVEGKDVLLCKLGGANDVQIPNIIYAEWNTKTLKVQDANGHFFVINAAKDSLCCLCGDRVAGPMDEAAYRKYLSETGKLNRLPNTARFR